MLNLQRAIKDAKAEKYQAQQDGWGTDSEYWGQIIGQYSKELQQLRGE